jgi:uncharacterized protein (TIGR02466 family)
LSPGHVEKFMSIDFEPRRDLSLSFATPIARMRVKEASRINPGIRKAILEKESASQSAVRSNVGGWHSSDDLLEWSEPGFETLKATMRDAAVAMTKLTIGRKTFEGRVKLTAWANVMRHGGYHQPHTHPHNHWSGVYYVDAGHPDPDWPKSGKIEIQDPRERAEMFRLPDDPYGLTAEFQAEAGAMVIWPSWLLHWVNPFYGEGERISIAFNARIEQPRTTP